MRSGNMFYTVLYPQGLVQCHGSEIYVCQQTNNTHTFKKKKKTLQELDPNYWHSLEAFLGPHDAFKLSK